LLPKVLRVVVYPLVIAGVGGAFFLRSVLTPEPIIQPVQFNHKLHTENLSLDCATCHTGVFWQEFSGRPPLPVCAKCHTEAANAEIAEATPGPKRYVANETCKLCHNKADHGSQWGIWKGSPHAKGFETLLGEPALKIARARGLDRPPSEAYQCLRCHTTAYDRETESVPEPLKVEDGVQCEACHGAGSRHVVDGRNYLLGRDLSIDFTANIETPNERTCKQCHRRQSPTWDPNRYTENGRPTGFSFQQAFEKIVHTVNRRFEEDFAGIDEVKVGDNEKALVASYIESGEDIPWNRIYDVPGHVYFSHRRHVAVASVECATCHGDIASSTTPPPAPLNDISMAFCIDCHEKEKVTTDCNACHR
jgi:predicted CXXCH cytochrome family protein